MAQAAWGPPHQPALYIGHGGCFEFKTPTVATVREHRAPCHLNESNGDTSPLQRSDMGDPGGKGASLCHSVSVSRLRLTARSHQTAPSRGELLEHQYMSSEG